MVLSRTDHHEMHSKTSIVVARAGPLQARLRLYRRPPTRARSWRRATLWLGRLDDRALKRATTSTASAVVLPQPRPLRFECDARTVERLLDDDLVNQCADHTLGTAHRAVDHDKRKRCPPLQIEAIPIEKSASLTDLAAGEHIRPSLARLLCSGDQLRARSMKRLGKPGDAMGFQSPLEHREGVVVGLEHLVPHR